VLAKVNLKSIIFPLTLAASLSLSPLAMAHGHGGSNSSGSHSGRSHVIGTHSSHAHLSTPCSQHSTPQITHHNSSYAQGVKRDSHGKIARSQQAKNDFKHQPRAHQQGSLAVRVQAM